MLWVESLGLNSIEALVNRLVGKFMHRVVRGQYFKMWVNRLGMDRFLGYASTLHVPCKGWICIQYYSSSNAKKLLNRVWLWGSSSLVLKHWHPTCNPMTEPFVIRHYWALLPV